MDLNCRVGCGLGCVSWPAADAVTDYFTKVLEDDLKAIVKPQYVDQLPRAIKGPVKTVKPLIEAKSELGNLDHIMDVLGTFRLRLYRGRRC